METKKCRSCGASSHSSMRYCEFCDSPLVQQNDYPNENKPSSSLGQEGFVFAGLEDELAKNLSLQTKSSFFVTEIHCNDEMILQVLAAEGVSDYLKTDNPSFPGLAIHMVIPREDKHMYQKFKALDEALLFVHSDDPESSFHDFMIDMGADVKGASKLVSKLLIEVNGLSKDSHLEYDTQDYNG